jgi:hypothetical protein
MSGSIGLKWANVKRRLTIAERNVKTDPGGALSLCAEVRDLFIEYGWPDWWSRVERLENDARLQIRRR